MNYSQMLKRAVEKMPKLVEERERFDIPKVIGHLEGNKTVINNFQKISQIFRRPADHLLKFLLKELAAPGEIKHSGLLVLGTKCSANLINKKIKEYAIKFVLCPLCGKPDTELLKEAGFSILKCSACGEKTPIKSRI